MSEVEKMPLEGTQLGHYRLIKQIGGGGMSEVYLAQDLNIQGRQHANSNDGKEYLFRVCQDNQHYYLYNCPGFNKSCQNLTSNLSLDINLGLNQNNTIAIVVNGSGIDLYINGNNVDSVTDTTYSSGNIGLVASTINNTTEVVYSNLKIWM
jgi:hypothetical protein